MRFVGYLMRLGTVAVVLALTLSLATGVLAGGRPLSTMLSGANEVPPADPDGTGTARIWLNQGRGTVCWSIHVENITLPALAAHIHSAAAGVNGPIVVPLTAPDADGDATGCATGVDRALIKAIRQHPRQYYVNVHTTDFPAGAVRGQLSWHAKPQ